MSEKQRSLAGGVSILGLAGLICKVVGVLYRIPLARTLGGFGMGAYQQVFQAYNLLLAVSSAGIPVAISRMVAHYVTLSDARNARAIFRVALCLLAALGAVATALLVCFAAPLSSWVGNPEAREGYIAIAPSLLLVCVMSAFRGYLQGRRHMLPTAVSQLIEQVGKVFIALPMAAAFSARGGVAWGAAGALLGTSIAEAAALAYIAVSAWRKGGALKAITQDESAEILPKKRIASHLARVALPITLGACIVPLAGLVDAAMLVNLMKGVGLGEEEAVVRFGLYSGIVISLINVPTALAMAMSTNLVPDISAGVARKDKDYIRRESALGLRMAFLVGLPCSVGMSMLSKPIVETLFAGGEYTQAQLTLAGDLLSVSAMTIVLFTVVQATSGILQGLHRQKLPMITLLWGVAVKIALNVALVSRSDINIHGAPIASLCCYTVSMIPNILYVRKYTGLRLDVAALLVRPGVACAGMALCVYLLQAVLPSGAVWLGVTIGLGAVVFFALALVCKAITREDLPARFRRK